MLYLYHPFPLVAKPPNPGLVSIYSVGVSIWGVIDVREKGLLDKKMFGGSIR